MKIQVLGSGCPTCEKLHKLVEEIANEAGRNDELEYVIGDTGVRKILELGLMSSPVLLVDGRVVMVGFIPDKNKIREKLYGHI